MKKVLVLMMILAQSAVVSAQPGEAEGPTGHISPIADEGGVLKGQRQTDNTPPVIRAIEDTVNIQQNNKIYTLWFFIVPNENIPDIASTASYKIARCLNADCTDQAATTYTPSRTIPLLDFALGRGITADITFNSVEEVRATWGFVLLRASDSVLRDAAGNPPVNTNGETIEENGIVGLVSEGAIADRDRRPPRIPLRVGQVRRIGDSETYELVFWVIPPAFKSIPTLYDGASYRLIRVLNTNAREDITDDATSFRIEETDRVIVVRDSGLREFVERAKLTYEVPVPDSELESIKGFMVARAGADDLLDRWSNLPVRAEDNMPIGIRTNGLLRSTPVSLIQPRIRTKVFLGGPLR